MSGNASRPEALVKPPVLRSMKGFEVRLRSGKGFSRGELTKVGLTVKEALKLGIPVDKRRRSVHDWNVEILRKFLESAGKKA